LSCLKISDIAFSAIGRVAFPKGELEKDKQNGYFEWKDFQSFSRSIDF